MSCPTCLHFCFIPSFWRYCETACSAQSVTPSLTGYQQRPYWPEKVKTHKLWVTEGFFPSNIKQHPNNKIKLKYCSHFSANNFMACQQDGFNNRHKNLSGFVLFFYVVGLFSFFLLCTPAIWTSIRGFFPTNSVVSGSRSNTSFPKIFPSFWFCIGDVHVLTI